MIFSPNPDGKSNPICPTLSVGKSGPALCVGQKCAMFRILWSPGRQIFSERRGSILLKSYVALKLIGQCGLIKIRNGIHSPQNELAQRIDALIKRGVMKMTEPEIESAKTVLSKNPDEEDLI